MMNQQSNRAAKQQNKYVYKEIAACRSRFTPASLPDRTPLGCLSSCPRKTTKTAALASPAEGNGKERPCSWLPASEKPACRQFAGLKPFTFVCARGKKLSFFSVKMNFYWKKAKQITPINTPKSQRRFLEKYPKREREKMKNEN